MGREGDAAQWGFVSGRRCVRQQTRVDVVAGLQGWSLGARAQIVETYLRGKGIDEQKPGTTQSEHRSMHGNEGDRGLRADHDSGWRRMDPSFPAARCAVGAVGHGLSGSQAWRRSGRCSTLACIRQAAQWAQGHDQMAADRSAGRGSLQSLHLLAVCLVEPALRCCST